MKTISPPELFDMYHDALWGQFPKLSDLRDEIVCQANIAFGHTDLEVACRIYDALDRQAASYFQIRFPAQFEELREHGYVH